MTAVIQVFGPVYHANDAKNRLHEFRYLSTTCLSRRDHLLLNQLWISDSTAVNYPNEMGLL